MENEAIIHSDESSELPELYTKKPFEIEKLKPNKIVWAEYKGLHWPALVRHVDKKIRKVGVWYLDAPKKTFKVPYRKIHDFCDAEFSKEVNNQAKLTPFAKKHHEVYRKSLTFLMRRHWGLKDNPADFFDKSKPYFLLEAFYSENPDFDLTSEDASTETINEIVENLEKSSEGESITESVEESFQKPEILLDLYREDRLYSDETEDKILNLIKEGCTDDHLLNVWNSKITSERHDLYLEALNTRNFKLLINSPPYIPLNNRDRLQNINMYLYELYEKRIGKDKPKMNEYIVSVWLPEAIDKAISLMNSVSSQDIGKHDRSSFSNLPEPTLVPVCCNNDNLACLPNIAKTPKPPIQRMNKITKSQGIIKTKTRSFNRRFPCSAPPAMQVIADKVDGLESSVQDLQCQVAKERKSIFGSDSSDDSTGSDNPANKSIRRKRRKKSKIC